MRRVAPHPALSSIVCAALLALLVLSTAAPASALNPDGALEGVVRDETSGDPIAGALVRAVHAQYGWVDDTSTDASGRYRVVLRPGEYDVIAAAAGHATGMAQVGVGTGHTTWHNVSLSAVSETAVVQGFVTEAGSGAPVTVGRIIATDWLSTTYRNGSDLDAVGFYEIRLAPDWYDLFTEGIFGYDTASTSVYLSSGEQAWENFTLNPNPLNGRMNGTVLDARTFAPIPNATVDIDVDGLRLPTAVANATGWYDLPIPSGWADITVDAVGYLPALDTDYFWDGDLIVRNFYLSPLGATVRGYVRDRDTGQPVPGATVEASTWDAFYDMAVADAAGFYSLQVPADSIDLQAGATGYASVYAWTRPSEGQTVWVNLSIPSINSRIQGYVVAAGSGARVPGVNVAAYDSTSSFVATTTTNAAGAFGFDAVSTGFLTVTAYASAGYSAGVSYGITRPGRISWINVTVYPPTATVRVSVVDAANGSAIAGAVVSLSWAGAYYDWGLTDAGGSVDLASPEGPLAYVWASATGYLGSSVTLSIAPGTNTVEVRLLRDLPADVTLQGYITDEGGAPVWSALVEVSGYEGAEASDYTDSSGYYSMSIVAARQVVRASDWGSATNASVVDPAPGTVVWVNLTLYADAEPPWVLSFTATPDVGVGPVNPTTLLATLQERSLDSASLQLYRLWSSAGGLGTFQYLTAIPGSMAISSPAPMRFEASGTWNAFALGGYLDDGVSRAWWPASAGSAPNTRVVYGLWRNATLGPVGSNALFDATSGRLVVLLLPMIGYVSPADVPGSTFQPYTSGVVADLATDAFVSYTTVQGPTLSVASMSLGVQDSMPTGLAGAYVSLFDAAGEWNSSWVSFGVDGTPPVADAGGPYGTDPGSLVVLDGTRSQDDSSIVNHTWTFTDGVPRTLYGAMVSYRFMAQGAYTVTLVVRDAAGNSDSDTAVVTVGTDVTAPTAVAGPDRTVDEDAVVAFDGSGSSDDFGIVSYAWTFADGGPQTLTGVTPSYTFLTPGTFTITLTVRDAAGHSATDSLVVTVRDLTPPTVSIASPADGANVSGYVDVTVAVADNAGVARVEFFVDGTLAGTDSTAPFILRIDTRLLTLGNHTIEVIAHDAAGNSASDSGRIQVVPYTGTGTGSILDGGILLILLLLATAAIAVVAIALMLARRNRRAAMAPSPHAPEAPVPPPMEPVPPTAPETEALDELDRL